MAKRVLDSLPRPKNAGRLPPGVRKKPRQMPAEARVVISLAAVEWICKLIRTWRGKTIQWEEVRAKVNSKYETTWTRQALSSHDTIKKVFQAKKKQLRELKEAAAGPRKVKPRNASVSVFQARIKFLEDQVVGLERKIADYEAQFVRWQQNAHLAGVPLSKLNKKTEGGDRGRSDK
jgi:hypothetical protein